MNECFTNGWNGTNISEQQKKNGSYVLQQMNKETQIKWVTQFKSVFVFFSPPLTNMLIRQRIRITRFVQIRGALSYTCVS